MKTLKNYDAVVEQIAETMRQLDKDSCDFQIDIYLYIDDEGNGEIDTFTNPGGNSWRDDDHITVYCDGPHYDDYFDIDILADGSSEDDNEPEYKTWDDLTDDEKEEFLPDMSDYIENAMHHLDMALNPRW